ncbi:hypothetical protein OS493_008338 [Desmophyllum pertusum]|uniref:Fibrinogen C-terminal domain-containing protein n=1 Tax=Desmophyllum pertusum TaxID=174260 RepID=A0A9X0DA71_9CNID|nr:hypothetical protein OS493_008338 [Desmophyllum pertusum]
MKLFLVVALMSCIPAIRGGRNANPCSSSVYKELTEADRERRFTQETGKSDASDLQAGNWYRFTGDAGFKLSNRLKRNVCETGPACGTNYPGFMIGSNPKKIKNNASKKKVCFTEGSNCCAKKIFIKVKRCPGDFLVYKLPAPPSGNYRYCGQKTSYKSLIRIIVYFVKEKGSPPKDLHNPPTFCSSPPATPRPVNTGEDKDHPGKSCKAVKDENPQGGSGLYWINPAGGKAFRAYCDQETDGGGWTLVYSYHFTNYPNFVSGSNAVTPRPSWPANGDIPESKTVPLSETQWDAMDFDLWKQIGHEFMATSNINHWIVCNDGTGSLVEYRAGTLSCRVVKNIASACLNVAPDEIRVLTKESSANYGPHLYYSKSSSWLKTYYYWESSTQSANWPTHDPCGRNGLSHVKNVPNAHGNIFIR